MSSTCSCFGRNEKENRTCKFKVTVSHNEESSPTFPPPCLQQVTKIRKKTKPIRRCVICKCKKIPEDPCEKVKLPKIGKGMKMYLDRLDEFGVTHCQCHRPKSCCRCNCALFSHRPIAQSIVCPKQRPICQKVCFIDDPPYTLSKNDDGPCHTEACCKRCCPCSHGSRTYKNLRIDVWHHLPEIAAKSSLRQHPPEGKCWEDVIINSAALCRAVLNECDAETRLRCRLPSWVFR